MAPPHWVRQRLAIPLAKVICAEEHRAVEEDRETWLHLGIRAK